MDSLIYVYTYVVFLVVEKQTWNFSIFMNNTWIEDDEKFGLLTELRIQFKEKQKMKTHCEPNLSETADYCQTGYR